MKHCSYEIMCQIADFLGEPLEEVFPRPGSSVGRRTS
jgi:hypothetical protein